MKSNRILLSTLGLIAGIASLAPATALAGGPLLSGYGGPGAGDQAILGATLIGGPSGGGSGGSPSNGGGSGASGVAAAPAQSSAARGAGAASSGSGSVGGSQGGGSAARGHSTAGARGGQATPHRAAGANPQSPAHLQGLSGVTTDAAAESWFSGDDLLALALVAGVLALVAVTTVRLTGARHG